VGNKSHFAFNQKFTRTHQNDQVHWHSGETITQNSTEQVVFAAHFCANTIRCPCGNTAFQFVIVKRIHSAQRHEQQTTIRLFFVLSVALQLSSVLRHLIAEVPRSLQLDTHTRAHIHTQQDFSE